MTMRERWLAVAFAAAAGIAAAPDPAGAPAASAAPAAAEAKAAEVKAPEVGDIAPGFTLPGSDGRVYSLSEFKGKKAVVVAWFPKAFTGG